MKFVTWNIDSLNAALTGDSERSRQSRQVLHDIAACSPQVFAIQETKLPAAGPSKKQKASLESIFPGYRIAWRSSQEPARKGYAGTMCLYRPEGGQEVSPLYPQIGAPEPMDSEGRILTLEFPGFYLTDVYTPNSGDGLRRLEERQVWDDRYRSYLQDLDQVKPVIACGDFNVAHEEIDLAHPASNRRSAGFTDEERDKFGQLLDAGFADTFRRLHPNQAGVYTWWAQRAVTSKVNNSGWRIDYWLVSDRLMDKVRGVSVMDTGERRDHAPLVMEIDL